MIERPCEFMERKSMGKYGERKGTGKYGLGQKDLETGQKNFSQGTR